MLRTTSVSPGYVRTELADSIDDDAVRDQIRRGMDEFAIRSRSGAPRATPRAYSCGVPESHDLEVDQESYQRGLQDGRAARARARELGAESDSESNAQSAGSRGQREAYLRGYRAGLSD